MLIHCQSAIVYYQKEGIWNTYLGLGCNIGILLRKYSVSIFTVMANYTHVPLKTAERCGISAMNFNTREGKTANLSQIIFEQQPWLQQKMCGDSMQLG